MLLLFLFLEKAQQLLQLQHSNKGSITREAGFQPWGRLARNYIAKGGTDIGSQEVNPKSLVHTEESWKRPL